VSDGRAHDGTAIPPERAKIVFQTAKGQRGLLYRGISFGLFACRPTFWQRRFRAGLLAGTGQAPHRRPLKTRKETISGI
jgi:hypothetical protein